jgi:hypothetical protein
MIDRLSVAALRLRHLAEQADRPDADAAHRARCAAMVACVAQQRRDLAACLGALFHGLPGRARTLQNLSPVQDVQRPQPQPRAAARGRLWVNQPCRADPAGPVRGGHRAGAGRFARQPGALDLALDYGRAAIKSLDFVNAIEAAKGILLAAHAGPVERLMATRLLCVACAQLGIPHVARPFIDQIPAASSPSRWTAAGPPAC